MTYSLLLLQYPLFFQLLLIILFLTQEASQRFVKAQVFKLYDIVTWKLAHLATILQI